jgi:hypothetical protein
MGVSSSISWLAAWFVWLARLEIMDWFARVFAVHFTMGFSLHVLCLFFSSSLRGYFLWRYPSSLLPFYAVLVHEVFPCSESVYPCCAFLWIAPRSSCDFMRCCFVMESTLPSCYSFYVVLRCMARNLMMFVGSFVLFMLCWSTMCFPLQFCVSLLCLNGRFLWRSPSFFALL